MLQTQSMSCSFCYDDENDGDVDDDDNDDDDDYDDDYDDDDDDNIVKVTMEMWPSTERFEKLPVYKHVFVSVLIF